MGAWVGVVGCSPAEPPASLPASSPLVVESAPLRVEWSGCAEVRVQDDVMRCLVAADSVLHLWLEDSPVETLEIEVDGRPAEVERHVIEGEPGEGRRVRMPAGAAELVVRRTSDASTWSLALGPVSTDPPAEALRSAKAELGRALSRSDAAEAGRIATRAFDLALAEGRSSEAVDLLLVAVFELSRRRLDPAVVDELLGRVEDVARRTPKGRGDLAAYRGLYLWYQGATQDAAESLRDAARQAVRLEDAALAADSIPIYAETLAQLGYFEDARRWARESVRIARERDPCDLGSALRTAGWVSLMLRQRGHPHDDPAPFLVEAVHVLGPEGACPRPARLGGARLSLAMLALDRDRLDDAAAELERIDRAKLRPDERVLADDLAVRLSLVHEASALRWAAYRSLAESVEAADSADARWRLHTRRGRLLELDRDEPRALEAYRDAEGELDALVRLRAVGIGRGELADRYHESTAALVSLLVARGELDEAWCMVRQDQARRRTAAAATSTLADAERVPLEDEIRRYRKHRIEAEALEGKADGLPRDEAELVLRDAAQVRAQASDLANALAKTLGTLAPHPRCDELSPPAPGELLLGLYPREHDWLVLTHDGAQTSVAIVPAPGLDDDPEGLAHALLDPVASRLDAASRVRVLAHRDAQRLDVHALPWRGEPLGVGRAVSYGVELPVASELVELGHRALLVADPTDTLEGARVEVELVRERLAAGGWSTEVISRHNAPAVGTVSLAGYDLFHYAGHAEASVRPEHGGWPPYEGGGAGWAAFLELGPAGRLTVHDVMTTRPAPYAAVLAGCRTGALELDTGQTTMALAFLVAGAEQVIASAEAVDDARGARLAAGLYEALASAPALDLPLALQHAQRGLWTDGEPLSGYRVWVR